MIQSWVIHQNQKENHTNFVFKLLGYRTAVMQAIQEYNSKTCVRFKPYTAALARQAGGYVEFMHGGGYAYYYNKLFIILLHDLTL